jgi:hypothetical protein
MACGFCGYKQMQLKLRSLVTQVIDEEFAAVQTTLKLSTEEASKTTCSGRVV